jgi:Fe-S oxidoreductase
MIRRIFAPGCAMMIYKPELANRIYDLLNDQLGNIEMSLFCCNHDPQFASATEIINICPGCDRRYRKDYPNTSTTSLWEILAEGEFFKFPDYRGASMTILDACPTRENEKVQISIRTLLEKMNITLVEPKNTRTRSTCCGDSFYGEIPTEKVIAQMEKRTSEMPEEDVVVYCVSCVKSIYIGGKQSRYLVDLLFEEETFPQTFHPDAWHNELRQYISAHEY